MAYLAKSALFTEVRDLINDPAPGNLVSDTDLEAFADRAARNVSSIALCYSSTAHPSGVPTLTESVATLASTYRYTLTTQFIKIHSVIFEPAAAATDPYALQRILPWMMGHDKAQGITGTAVAPKYYWHFGKSLFIWPSPIGTGVNVGTAYIKVFGVVCAYDYSHTDTNIIYGVPDRLQAVVLDYVKACACIKAGKFRKASEYMSNYLEAINFERKDNYDNKQTPHSKDMYDIPNRNVAAKQA